MQPDSVVPMSIKGQELHRKRSPSGVPHTELIGRCAKMAAGQAPRCWEPVRTDSLSSFGAIASVFDRGVAEKVLRERFQVVIADGGRLPKRKGTKADTQKSNQLGTAEAFTKYLATSLQMLKPDAQLSKEDAEFVVATYQEEMEKRFPLLACVWTLRALVGQVAEAAMLVDRCHYVAEQGVAVGKDRVASYLVPVMDHLRSPRNFAVVAFRN